MLKTRTDVIKQYFTKRAIVVLSIRSVLTAALLYLVYRDTGSIALVTCLALLFVVFEIGAFTVSTINGSVSMITQILAQPHRGRASRPQMYDINRGDV